MKNQFCRSGWVAVLAMVIASSFALGADWSRFRGENGLGTADSAVPDAWSATENVKWKAELPGPGFSCPVVVGDRVFVTCYSGYGVNADDPGDINELKRHLVCVDKADGSIQWTKTVDATQPEDPYVRPGTITHGYASNTPVSDGEMVYAFFGKSGVIAYDMEGNQVWRTSVGTESDPQAWGTAASPILYKDLVLVNASAESRSIVALDKKSGEERWRAEAEGLASTWSTPVLARTDSGTEVLVPTPDEIWALDAESGKLKWYAAGIGARGMASSLIVDDGVVYSIGAMRGGGAVAVRTGGKGDVTDSHIVWNGPAHGQFGTPVLHDGYFYGVDDSGIAFCVDAANGEAKYRIRLATGEVAEEQSAEGMRGGGMQGRQEGAPRGVAENRGMRQRAQRDGPSRGGRRGGGGGMFADRSYGSPILAGGKIYFTDHAGQTYVLAPNPEKFTLLGKNEIATDDRDFNATPAAVDGTLFLRSNKYLYCIAE